MKVLSRLALIVLLVGIMVFPASPIAALPQQNDISGYYTCRCSIKFRTLDGGVPGPKYRTMGISLFVGEGLSGYVFIDELMEFPAVGWGDYGLTAARPFFSLTVDPSFNGFPFNDPYLSANVTGRVTFKNGVPYKVQGIIQGFYDSATPYYFKSSFTGTWDGNNN